uniref:Uncharacterized protein n=1 Tax=Candidatus Kentrum sp. LFY TaxID=2126342 RepID=A0A450UIU8_9GAMM|nr:MAG: hypothetical protein BECKLFY1418A_GA0070994_102318 [Candidatus Kentron sp. LFY]
MHKTTARFRCGFDALPSDVQEIARRNYDLLEENPRHPSLHFKKVCKLWSVRVGRGHSATKAATESCCRPWRLGPGIPFRDDEGGCFRRLRRNSALPSSRHGLAGPSARDGKNYP